jgi:hypothetical protein
MASAALEENLNIAGKTSAEIEHAERILGDAKHKAEGADHGLSQSQIRRFVLKMDWRILPILGLIYALSIIDRINIGSAKVLGMEEDLNLGDGPRYSIILMLFFPA